MTENNAICYVPPQRWAQLIAGVEVIVGNINCLVIGRTLYGLVKDEKRLINKISQELIMQHAELDAEAAHNYASKAVTKMYIMVSITLFLTIFSFFMAIILVVGARKSKPLLLKCWIAYAIVACIWTFILIHTDITDTNYVGASIRVILTVTIKSFGVYSAILCIKDIIIARDTHSVNTKDGSKASISAFPA